MPAFKCVFLACAIYGLIKFVGYNVDYMNNPDSPAMAVKLVGVFNWLVIFVICYAAATLIRGFAIWLVYW